MTWHFVLNKSPVIAGKMIQQISYRFLAIDSKNVYLAETGFITGYQY